MIRNITSLCDVRKSQQKFLCFSLECRHCYHFQKSLLTTHDANFSAKKSCLLTALEWLEILKMVSCIRMYKALTITMMSVEGFKCYVPINSTGIGPSGHFWSLAKFLGISHPYVGIEKCKFMTWGNFMLILFYRCCKLKSGKFLFYVCIYL